MREGHIYIDGIISSEYHQKIRKDIENLGDYKELIVHIQSPGGAVYSGYNIYHILKAQGKPITAIIEGECQSIATIIALAADKVIARNPSIFMIHNPWVQLAGDASDLEKGANELRKIGEDIIDIYVQKTKLSRDKIVTMMENETSMSAKEALEHGFIDEIREPLRAVALGKTKQIKMENIFDNFGKKLAKLMRDAFKPQNLELKLTDGTAIFVETEDGDLVGKMVYIGESVAPAGEHTLEDGRVIVVSEEGMITEVKEPSSAEDKMKEEIAALKAELSAIKAEKEAEVAKNQKAFNAMQELQKEFQALKQKTVGKDQPPKDEPNKGENKKVINAHMAELEQELFTPQFMAAMKAQFQNMKK